MLLTLTGACAVLWYRWRWRSRLLLLLVASFASTAVYWLLGYSAMRAVYGAQLVFMAVFAYLAIQAARTGVRPVVVAVALAATGLAFITQTMSVMRIKDHNAHVLAQRERSLAAEVEACGSSCVIEYQPPNAGLNKDWVLSRRYWPSYLEWIAVKYGPGKSIGWVLVTQGAGANPNQSSLKAGE